VIYKPCTYLDKTPNPCSCSRRHSQTKRDSGYCTFHEHVHHVFASQVRDAMEERNIPYRKGTALKLVREDAKMRAIAATNANETRRATQVGYELARLWAYNSATDLVPKKGTRLKVVPQPIGTTISIADANALLGIAAEHEQQMNEMRTILDEVQQRLQSLESVQVLPADQAPPDYVDQATAQEEEDFLALYESAIARLN
jgi:hypothetical protein